MDDSSSPSNASTRYDELSQERTAYVDRGEELAGWTIPNIFSPNTTKGQDIEDPHQAIGARCVNSLANRLMLALFPPKGNFFRLRFDEQLMQEARSNNPEVEAELKKALNEYEKALATHAESLCRQTLFEAMKLLIVTGNALLHADEEGMLRCFNLSQYVCRRGPNGKLLELIVKESYPFELLSEEMRKLIETDKADASEEEQKQKKNVDLFTVVKISPESKKVQKWEQYQEIEGGHRVPGSDGNYTQEDLPWIPLRWIKKDGESYGRSHCEDYRGDLEEAEKGSRDMAVARKIASKAIAFVKPGSQTAFEIGKMQSAQPGSFLMGNAEDVTWLHSQGKLSDFAFAAQRLDKIEAALGYAFLLTQSIQRDAERVTAEEIRLMAQELETTLGGVYSVLAVELQMPLVNLMLGRLIRKKIVPKIPRDTYKPVIITGLQALSKGHELNNLQMFSQTVNATVGPKALEYLNIGELIKRCADTLSIETEGLLKSDEQLQQEQQAAMEQQAMQQAITPGITQLGGLLQKGMENGEGNQDPGTNPEGEAAATPEGM